MVEKNSLKNIKRTVERAICPYCDRRFAIAPISEIVRHMNIRRDEPFRTGLVYMSQKGANIITPGGRMEDGLVLGGYMTHSYMHHVVTAYYDTTNPEGLIFENNIKLRRVKELERRFAEREIELPRLEELSEIRFRYENYRNNPNTDKNSHILKALAGLKPEELVGISLRVLKLQRK